MNLKLQRPAGMLLASLALAVSACTSAPQSAPATQAPAPAASAVAKAPSPAASPAASPVASPAAVPSPAASPVAGGQTAQVPLVKVAGFPSKPVQIIVPFAPGGGYDALARQLGSPMERDMGQPVVVQNVPGGGTRIAARQFQQAPADGHTLGYFSDNGLYASSLVEPSEGFDLNRWVWVAGVRTSPVAVYVGKDSPYKTIEDVLAADKAGTRIRIPHNGVGGGFIVNDIVFASALSMQNVALLGGYQGTADMVPALVRGDVDIAVLSPIASTINFVRSGDIRPLVVLATERSPLLPDVRTVAEARLPNADELAQQSSLSGIAVGPNTPPDRLRALESAVLRALQDPGFVSWARQAGAADDLRPLTGEQMAQAKKAEYQTITRYSDQFKKLMGS
ncbi:MAG TPA: tripartite tricarboxylate transporter substrate binding protein [Chloroflexota bacterium]